MALDSHAQGSERTLASSDSSPPRFVVTGTGRSGTAYCALVLQEQGVRAGHEAVYRPDHRGSWRGLEGDVSWLAVPRLEAERFEGRVVHVVRDPRWCIRSSLRIGKFQRAPRDETPWLRYARLHCPTAWLAADPYERACRFWVEWNQRAEAVADVTLRLEALSPAVLLDAIGRDLASATSSLVPQTANHRECSYAEWPEITWADLPRDVAELATRYGYRAASPSAAATPSAGLLHPSLTIEPVAD